MTNVPGFVGFSFRRFEERRDAENSPGINPSYRKIGTVPRVNLQKFTRNREKRNTRDYFTYRNSIFRMLHLARNRSQSVHYCPSGTPVHSQTAGNLKIHLTSAEIPAVACLR